MSFILLFTRASRPRICIMCGACIYQRHCGNRIGRTAVAPAVLSASWLAAQSIGDRGNSGMYPHGDAPRILPVDVATGF